MEHGQSSTFREEPDQPVQHASSLPEAAQAALRRMDSSRRAISTMQFLPEVGIFSMLRGASVRAPSDVSHDSASSLSSSEGDDAPLDEVDALAAQQHAQLLQRRRVWSHRIGLRPAAAGAWAAHADHPAATAVMYAAASAGASAAFVITYTWGSDELYLTYLSVAAMLLTITILIAHWIVGPAYLKSYLGMVHVVLQLLCVFAIEIPLPFRSLSRLPFRNRVLFLVRPV